MHAALLIVSVVTHRFFMTRYRVNRIKELYKQALISGKIVFVGVKFRHVDFDVRSFVRKLTFQEWVQLSSHFPGEYLDTNVNTTSIKFLHDQLNYIKRTIIPYFTLKKGVIGTPQRVSREKLIH